MANQSPPNSPYSSAPTPATTGTLADLTDMIWHKTPMKMYGVSDSKLDELTAGYNSLYLFFSGICLGASVSLFVGLRTTTVQADKPMYLAASITTVILGVFFGLMGIHNYLRASRAKNRLYQQSIPIEPHT
jgi:hypothetical protein